MGKGAKNERQAAQCFQAAGWATYRPATVRYGENDVFGLFDLLAVHPDRSRVRAVQVKTNGNRGITSWQRQTWLWRRLGWKTDYLSRHDREGWVLTAVCDNSRRTVVDERNWSGNIGDGLIEFLAGERDPLEGPR